jgi:hypothetical protein
MAVPLEKIPRLDIPLHTLIGRLSCSHCHQDLQDHSRPVTTALTHLFTVNLTAVAVAHSELHTSHGGTPPQGDSCGRCNAQNYTV